MNRFTCPLWGPLLDYTVRRQYAGANLGDFFAHDLGLGHLGRLPFLALALTVVIVAERNSPSSLGRRSSSSRTAATSFADFAASDLKLPRVWVMAVLAILVAATVRSSWRSAWSRLPNKSDEVLRADFAIG